MHPFKTTIASLALGVLLAIGCQNPPAETETAVTPKADSAVADDQKTNGNEKIIGNYVSGDYDKRMEGFDWVAAAIKEAGANKLTVQVRSRADKKRPTCTFDADLYKVDDQTYQTSVEGKTIFFRINGNKLVIAAGNAQDNAVLNFYCSGGATIAGAYTKIAGDLDQAQIDQTSFSKVLSLQGIGFNISSIKKSGQNTLTILPFGLEIDNSEVTLPIEGRVTGAEIEDLNADGSPELLVYTQADGSGSYGNVIGYSVNNKKSMSQVYFPPTANNAKINKGYMGHDEFSIAENTLVQRFPIYREGDTNAKPTGGTRQISYSLKEGEASRKFEIKKVEDF